MDMPRFMCAPPPHPVPNGANVNPQSHSAPGAPYHGQRGPRHSGPEPYVPPEPSAPLPSHPQAHPPRPYFYIPTMPPPPPIVQYPWPMPYPCNPFAGFPGMGYGMVMPPFLPTPYLEAPGYMFPQAPLPPVDYRRFHHSQVPGPYHHQSQNRRFRPPTYPPREMVNTEVQTEPPSAATSARIERSTTESGRGSTATSSPGSSSGRPAGTDERNHCATPDRLKDDFRVDRQGCARSTGIAGEVSKPRLAESGQPCVRKPLEMQKRNKGSVSEDIIAPSVCRSIGNCDRWSVASNDSLVPVCSSSDREEEEERVDVTKEGRVPSSTHHEIRERSMEQLVEQLCESEDQIPTRDKTVAGQETTNEHFMGRRSHKSVVDDDGEHGTKERETVIRHGRKANESLWSVNSVASYNPCRERVPQNGYLNESLNVWDGDLVSPEDSINVLARIYSASKTMNRSVWSVESLAPYIPSDEWVMRNGLLQSDAVAEEVADESKNGLLTNGGSLKAKKNRRRSRRYSMSSVESVSVCMPLVSLFDVYSQNMSPLLSQQQNFNMELAPHKMLESQSQIKQSKTIVEDPIQGQNMESSEREDPPLALPAVVPKIMKASIPSTEGEQGVFEKGRKLSENIEKEKQALNMEPEICAATMGHKRIPLTSQQNVFITPAIELGSHKRLEMESERNAENPIETLNNMEPSERECSLASPAVGPSEIKAPIPSAEEGDEDVSEKGSSEPEANKSPNQEVLNVAGLLGTMDSNSSLKEKIPCVGQLSPTHEEMGQEPLKDIWEQKQIKLEVMDQKVDDVSPSKQDRGVQTGRCMVPKLNKGNSDSKRMHKTKVDEGMTGHVQKNPKKLGKRRNWSQDHRPYYAEWHDEDPYNDPCRPGKPRGGNNGLKQR